MSSHCDFRREHEKEPGMDIFDAPRVDDEAGSAGQSAMLVNQLRQPLTVGGQRTLVQIGDA